MRAVARKARYLRRVVASYLGRSPSQLSFWWEMPAVSPGIETDCLGPYYMPFADKARYAGPFDGRGVPLLDYHGGIGRQHNPIAIAQYGLALHARHLATGSKSDLDAMRRQADWLVENLEPNAHGVPVWMHKFDWEYFRTLRAPWYSGLAQGQGVSLLLRAAQALNDERYRAAANEAMRSLSLDIAHGGVLLEDGDDLWIEEYLTEPPTHILNGFIWGLWGVYDHWLVTRDASVRARFDRHVETIERNLARFDTGSWSRYDLAPTRIPGVASPFYHSLHVVQLEVLHRLTGKPVFAQTAQRWRAYAARPWNRRRALAQKALFKAVHY